MRNRLELAKYFAELGFKTGAEIGVCQGYYSRTLCENIPSLKLWGIDTWSTVTDNHRRRHLHDAVYKEMLENLKPFIASGQYFIIRKKSMDALSDISDESLDFVYIDANHSYESVKEDLKWAKKVRKGGIVSGHDYYNSPSGKLGVIQAVNEYVKDNGVDLMLTEWDRKNPAGDERQPSWYFFK